MLKRNWIYRMRPLKEFSAYTQKNPFDIKLQLTFSSDKRRFNAIKTEYNNIKYYNAEIWTGSMIILPHIPK